MKAEVKQTSNPDKNGPFQAGIWINQSEIEALVNRLEPASWLRAGLKEKLADALAQAEQKNWQWAALKD